MIERLQLWNWRSFERLDLSFSDGTTFIVAPNGVGKTSLLLAVCWSLFGSESDVDARECIRAGAAAATVEVRLRLDNALPLLIKREVNEKGKVKSEYRLDNQIMEESDALDELRSMFGVSLAVAARLTLVSGSETFAIDKPLDIKDHLYSAYGVSTLLQNAQTAEALAKDLAKERAAIRSSSKSLLSDRASEEERSAVLEVEIAQLQERHGLLRAALNNFNAIVRISQAWITYDTEISQQASRLEELRQRTVDLLGNSVANHSSVDDISEALNQSRQDAQRQLDTLSEQMIKERVRVASAENAIELLTGEVPSCPTCLRGFHGDELPAAVDKQRDLAREAEAEVQVAVLRRQQQEERLEVLDGLARELVTVTQPVTQPEDERPDEITQTHDELMDSLLECQGELNTKKNELQRILDDLSADDRNRVVLEQQQSAYRNEAVAESLARTLRMSADEIVRTEIEPLADEVKWRWKLLFHNEGLQFKADGSITRMVGDRELPWSSLSGGERIWARLVAHLLIIASSTKVPFAWFDEPLEHLAPETRRSVASALAQVTIAGPLRQVIVTTYEHAIARQNASDLDSASVVYLRNAT